MQLIPDHRTQKVVCKYKLHPDLLCQASPGGRGMGYRQFVAAVGGDITKGCQFDVLKPVQISKMAAGHTATADGSHFNGHYYTSIW